MTVTEERAGIVPNFDDESESGRKIAIICSKGNLDMAYPGLIIANSALGEGVATRFGAHLPYLHGIAQVGGRELWQTAVELHPQAARKLGIADGAPVWVESPAGRVRAVLHLREGIRPDSAAIAVGLGRKALGPFAAGRGSNPLDLLDSAEPAFVTVRRAT